MSWTANGEYVDEPEPVRCPTCGGDCTVPVGWGRGKRTETCPRCLGDGVVDEL